MNYNNINDTESIFQRPRNRYLSRSSFLNIKNRIGRYDGDNRAKNLREIQQDEIEKIKRYDPTTFEFFQVFTNPIVISAKQQTPSLKSLPQLQIPNPNIFSKITGMMIQLFVNDIKGIRKLKISSKMINEIADLKEKMIAEIKQEQLLGQTQKTGFVEKLKSLFQKISKKKLTELSSQQVKETEQEELKLIMNIFNEIIESFRNLRSQISDINLSFFINSFFTITIGNIFKLFPEFGREQSLMNLRNIQCQFNLLSFAVFLGIEPLIVLFLLLGGNPSLTNQINQDASYQLMFFQMIFRNVAMGVKWNPRQKNEDKVYGSYNPEIESKIQTYEKMISNIQSIPNKTVNDERLLRDISMRLRELKNRIQKEQAQQQDSDKPKGNRLTIEDLQKEIQSIREILEQQQKQQQDQLKQEIVQKQQQPEGQQPQQPQGQQQQLIRGQLKVGYNFERYLCSNNKLRRILTLLSIFGTGIDLSLLVLQSDIAKKYIVRTGKQISLERVSSSILIAMSKEKFLNEKNILIIDSKYVKYSVYDLLRYFLIFNGFDGSNFTKYFSIRNTGYRNNFEKDNNDFITRAYRGAQSLGKQNLSVLESISLPPMPFNFISNINETSKPFNYSFFFYLISNQDISVNHKIELGCISLLQGADPNIMPNIAQDILSQLDSRVKRLSICDIFKVFLGSNYERIIRIFKLYSPNEFSKGVWDDKLGEIQKIMEKQEDMIRNLRRRQMNLQQTNLLLANTTKPLSRQLSSLNLATTPLKQQLPTTSLNIPFSRRFALNLETTPLPLRNVRQYEYNPLKVETQQPNIPVISSVPIEQSLNTGSMLTTVPSSSSSSFNKLHPQQLEPFQNSITGMSGGSKIKLRTFHFLEPKSYNEHAFRAEKPIIAGKMAYDFLRTHYKLKKGSSIMFTIEDREKDRKYNYIGEKVNNKIIIKST